MKSGKPIFDKFSLDTKKGQLAEEYYWKGYEAANLKNVKDWIRHETIDDQKSHLIFLSSQSICADSLSSWAGIGKKKVTFILLDCEPEKVKDSIKIVRLRGEDDA